MQKLLLLCTAMANRKRFWGVCVVLCWFYQGAVVSVNADPNYGTLDLN